MQTVEYTDDTLLQSSTTNDTVVYDNQVIFIRRQAAVSDIVHMSSQIVTGISLGNEGTQFNILNGDLLTTNTLRQDLLQFRMTGLVSQCLDTLHFQFVQVVVESFQHTIKSNFRCIRDK